MRALIESHVLLDFVSWKRALLAGVPSTWRDRFPTVGHIEIIGPPPFAVQMVKGTTRRDADRAQLTRRRLATAVLMMPAECVLRRIIELPIAALADLPEVLKLDVPISTPFEADEVLIGHKLILPARQGKIKVATAIVSKAVVAEFQTQAELEFRGKPGWVGLGNGIAVEVNQELAVRRKAAQRLDKLLALLALTLGVLVYWAGTTRQYQALSFERQQLTRTLAALEETSRLRQNIDLGRQRLEFVAQKRTAGLKMSPVLANVAAYLPADTYFLKFSIRGQNFEAVFAGPSSSLEQLRKIGDELLDAGYLFSTTNEGTAALSGTIRGRAGGAS